MKKIISVIFSIMIIIVAFIFIFQGIPPAHNIKKEVLEAIDNVTYYSYSADGIVKEIVTNMENDTKKFPFHDSWYSNYSMQYNASFRVDMSNRELKGEWHNRSVYHSNETQYLRWGDYNYWSALSGDHNWYGVSYLDKVRYIFEEGKTKYLNDETVNGSDCYKLEITSVFENKKLNDTYMDYLLPDRHKNSSFDKKFNEEYDCTILYWIEKNTFLPIKVFIEVRYFVNKTSYNSFLGNLTWNRTSYYKPEFRT